jgi:hypothetical protein
MTTTDSVSTLLDRLAQGEFSPEIIAELRRLSSDPGQLDRILEEMKARGLLDQVVTDAMRPDADSETARTLMPELHRQRSTVEIDVDRKEGVRCLSLDLESSEQGKPSISTWYFRAAIRMRSTFVRQSRTSTSTCTFSTRTETSSPWTRARHPMPTA